MYIDADYKNVFWNGDFGSSGNRNATGKVKMIINFDKERGEPFVNGILHGMFILDNQKLKWGDYFLRIMAYYFINLIGDDSLKIDDFYVVDSLMEECTKNKKLEERNR